MGSWFKGGTYLKIEKDDDPIFKVLTGTKYTFIHVSIIRMCNKTATKARLFQQNLLCLDLLQNTIGENNRKLLL